MSDPNRERWLTEATAWLDSYFGPTGTLNHAEIESARDAYLAACEKYAPRWVNCEEANRLDAGGWASHQTGPEEVNGEEFFCMVPPAPPPPGGEK